MSEETDVYQPEFTKELGEQLEKLVLDFLKSNEAKIPKCVKFSFSIVGRYGPNGYQTELETKASNRHAGHGGGEVLGEPMTTEDWQIVDELLSRTVCNLPTDLENLREIVQCRMEGKEPTGIRLRTASGLQQIFSSQDLPYRISGRTIVKLW